MTHAHAHSMRSPALLGILLLGLVLLGLSASGARSAEWPADSYVLQVDGLACPYCGYGIEKQFAQRDGVEDTTIHIDESVVVISVASGTRFSDDELERMVDNAGFSLGRIVQRPQTD